ncbi:MAG: tRNA (cytidine(56)-2'-O)-methyltransferase [Nitrososphaerota archaeon]|nr:tRNA (cytidine(56)-2'-O)-methyltransferase [Nitrososphaerales archaeon]MCX8192108.1 tRNA (cytidine(56)-2'-O)-methyltransferase [Nitrososphaerales archaeon]MDW8044421.1 tRNA (cytidine(56)-2'-O)-methyltransferase [Nitrososphaerota archaeon]
MKVCVLRLGHRLVRDDRITTHVGLVARAFGANKIWIVNAEEKVKESIDNVTRMWGGEFGVELIDDWRKVIKEWKNRGGLVVHLTMYGIHVDEVINKIRNSGKDILVIVGAEKVPGEVFKISDFNVAIGHQPHSEVAALAIFLDRLFGGEELKRMFNGYKIRVIPSEYGKRVEMVE